MRLSQIAFAAVLCCLPHHVSRARSLQEDQPAQSVGFLLGTPLFINESTTETEGRRLQDLRGYWAGSDLTWTNNDCSYITSDNFAACRNLCANVYNCKAVSYASPGSPKCARSCFLKTGSTDQFVGDGNFQSALVTPAATDTQRGFLWAGNDLTWTWNDCSSVTTSSADACKQWCTGTPACKVWSWVASSSSKCAASCYLKSAAGAKISNWDFISGQSGSSNSALSDTSLGGGNCLDPGATLAAHNGYRALHQNTGPLSWDAGLAATAQAYSNELAARGGFGLSHSGRAGVGENLFSAWGTVGTGMDNLNCQPAVDAWYLDEVGFMNWNNVATHTTDGSFEKVGHLTQMIWRSTTTVGCGAATCNRNGWPGRIVTCHYSPQGNIFNKAIWEANVQRPN